MGKSFAPRTAKKDRKHVEVASSINRQLFKINDEKLLKGAQLAEVQLSKITLREQVRTKFNDHSLKELADNIQINGLIQPLVLHREADKFILICGERRFRAMGLIGMKEAPCFILEGKGHEELMAIQFSENSSREELHYVDKADGIYNYQVATGASERKIQMALGISKSEVHRSLIIAKLTKNIKEAAKAHNIEKYVLVEYNDIEEDGPLKKELEAAILSGKITKRLELTKAKTNFNKIVSKKGEKKSTPGVRAKDKKQELNQDLPKKGRLKKDLFGSFKVSDKELNFPLNDKIF